MWSDMESGILEMILLLLNLADVACIASVCPQWRRIVKSFALDHRLTVRHRSWLVVSSRPYKQAIVLMNPLRRTTSPLSRSFCGAFGDWLVINDMFDGAYLYHPLLHRVQLPSLTTPPLNLANNGFYLCMDTSPVHVRKVILSSPPISAECLVALICGPKGLLAFCRLGDSSWIQYESDDESEEGRSYDDVVFYNGRLLALDNREFVWSFEFRSGQVERQLLFQSAADRIVPHFSLRFLVESMGQLLVVIQKRERHFVEYEGQRHPHCSTYDFEIFKLDADRRERTPLETLGKRVMFLSHTLSTAVASDEIEKDLSSDCIYFSDFTRSDPVHWVFFIEDKRKVQLGTFHRDGAMRCWGSRAPLFFSISAMWLFSLVV